MSTYQPGDYVKVEFRDDTGESEWMWVKVEHADDKEEVVFGQLDSLVELVADFWKGEMPLIIQPESRAISNEAGRCQEFFCIFLKLLNFSFLL
jgi:hypothetical protein